jgi:hypothetical protein
MVNFIINGKEAPLGKIRTGQDYILTNFEEDTLTFLIQQKGRPIEKSVQVADVITEALNYIDNHCAKNKICNDYFSGLNRKNPLSLRQILDTKKLQIFRLGGQEDKDMPAGFTHGWGPAYAQIGLNRISLTDSGQAAAAIVHELAHVAGAPGRDVDPRSLAAETSLNHCGLKRFYDDKAFGVVVTSSDKVLV